VDITDRKLAEELLRAGAITLKEQVTSKDQYLAHVSHDLRNPLTAIYQYSTLLLDGLAGPLATQQAEFVTTVLRSAKQVNAMIGHLLDATRADNGKLRIEPRGINISELVRDAIAVMLPAATKKGVSLDSVVDQAIPLAYADPVRVSQVLINLIDNAIKFTPTEGAVTVSASLPESNTASIKLSVFHFALPLQPEQPQFHLMQNAQNMYTMVSPSTDFRFLEAKILRPQSIPSFDSTGRPVAILGLAIGYGSNFLNVIHAENRLILGNGSHRAYALRDLGISQIPCLIQRVTRREELELVASADLSSSPDRYLKSPRPPMLRDYFDPALRKIVQVYRKNRVVRVQFGIEQTDSPAQ